MKKLGVVLQYEIMTYLKNKSYVISTVIIAVIAAAIMFVPRFFDISSITGVDKGTEENTENNAELVKKSAEMYLEILYSNPAGFRLTARMTTNYRQLKTMYLQRKDHRLPEWRAFCKWIETLPHADFITETK